MNKFPDDKVAAFLAELLQSSAKKSAIVEQCRSLFFSIHPSGSECIKYGGIMFSLEEEIAGVFAYKNHVSMEFGQGNAMNDPDEILEGSGKFRRHIKMEAIEQIEEKQLKFFIAQLD